MAEWFKNQSVCSQATSTPVSTLRRAKKLGAPGFAVNNKINWTELGPWIAANLPAVTKIEQDALTLREKKLQVDIELVEQKLDRVVEAERERTNGILKKVAEAASRDAQFILTKQYPQRLEGLTAPEIEKLMIEEIVPALFKTMRELKV